MYDHKQIIIVRKRHIPKNMPKTVISQHIPTIWVASITTNLTSVEEGPRWTAQDTAPLPKHLVLPTPPKGPDAPHFPPGWDMRWC